MSSVNEKNIFNETINYQIQSVQSQEKYEKKEKDNKSQSQELLAYIQNQFNEQQKIIDKQHEHRLSRWNSEELEKFLQLYLEYGPCWTFLSQKIITKNSYDLKNQFYNCLRRFSIILNKLQGKIYLNTKKSISSSLLITMIDFINKIKYTIEKMNLTPNPQSMLFMFRTRLLRLTLIQKNYQIDDLIDLLHLIKNINSKIRTFGIFRAKSRRKFLISLKLLSNIISFDNIISQPVTYQQIRQKINNSSQLRKQIISPDKFIDKITSNRQKYVQYQNLMELDLEFNVYPYDEIKLLEQYYGIIDESLPLSEQKVNKF